MSFMKAYAILCVYPIRLLGVSRIFSQQKMYIRTSCLHLFLNFSSVNVQLLILILHYYNTNNTVYLTSHAVV